ncbi:SDR family NAD(P)-dependent oxidoreductase [Paenibacillus sp. HJGM_3]|uniref:SDR family NAD(P)-dependent oxidoreductase n=1 Tax=Paenibacillus sp. HJGM_3 TaxID=3379816 RepID=UPI00385F468C
MTLNAYQGKVVGITGAGGGIGRVLARHYAAYGAALVLVDRDAEALKLTEAALGMNEAAGPSSAGAGAVYLHQTDLSVPGEIDALFERLRDEPGRLDVWINNAGLGCWKSPYTLTVEEWDYVMNTNVRGSFLCAREAAKLMRAQGGFIVNIASTRAVMSEPNSEAYAASKGGILSLTHALAVSLGPDRITVNAICPGWIETGDYSALREEDHAQHPAGRVGTPDDIARACLYFTDPANDFVTGTSLTVDGGMTRKMIYVE